MREVGTAAVMAVVIMVWLVITPIILNDMLCDGMAGELIGLCTFVEDRGIMMFQIMTVLVIILGVAVIVVTIRRVGDIRH